MGLQIYQHGNCCGAHIIDGFHDRESYREHYSRVHPEATRDQLEEWVNRYPTHAEMMRELRGKLNATTNRGQLMVILNQDQHRAWHDTLTRIFGFQLIYSDVANPNHPSRDARGNLFSRLFTYIWVRRPYQGDRETAGLSPLDQAPIGTPTDKLVLPEDPPPPPPPSFRVPPAANLPYGVRI
jgi:hypothetical protein